MHDAGHWGDNTEITERHLPPFEELIAFAITLEFDFSIARESISSGEEIHLDGMVNDQVHRHQRIDPLRVTTETCNRGSHRGKVYHCRDSCEILHDDARR